MMNTPNQLKQKVKNQQNQTMTQNFADFLAEFTWQCTVQ